VDCLSLDRGLKGCSLTSQLSSIIIWLGLAHGSNVASYKGFCPIKTFGLQVSWARYKIQNPILLTKSTRFEQCNWRRIQAWRSTRIIPEALLTWALHLMLKHWKNHYIYRYRFLLRSMHIFCPKSYWKDSILSRIFRDYNAVVTKESVTKGGKFIPLSA
jgi:hypothetical protein